MDSGLFPTEIAIRHVVNHSVNHRFTIELGPSITGLGRGFRNTLVALLVIKCSFELLQAVINRPCRPDPRNK